MGITTKKMETTIMGCIGFRVEGLGLPVLLAGGLARNKGIHYRFRV